MSQLFSPQPLSKKLFNLGMGFLAFALSILALIPLLAMVWAILSKGTPHLSWDVLTQLPAPVGMKDVPNGFANAIVGTGVMVAIASAISIPLGILTAIYLSEFGKNSAFANGVRFFVTILSAAPSIVVGVFAYAVIVIPFKGFSAIAGGFALSIIMLPVVALATEESLKLVPNAQRLASAALGAGFARTTLRIVLARALPGILTSSLLAIARASGETAPLIFTALFSQNWLESLSGPSASLSVMIFNYATSPFTEQKDLAWAAALILLGLVLLTNLLSRWATRKRWKTL
ncbi:phosphate ABC transporter permease PstA [Altericista sp. CCNU0014]|uniref:phosphate ABC transporter permease PstA n=1 Tax=Altericista sp. CCNU0014 TaxID=3082949 RepID=UPI00384A7597